jgi:GTP cyclohydrolase I
MDETRKIDDAANAHEWKNDIDQSVIQVAILQMLKAFGEDPNRQGLQRTPERVARMYVELQMMPSSMKNMTKW